MSTRSNIVLNKDGKYHMIYCHSDGYPSHNGRILLENYTNEEKIWELIQLGDISLLGGEIGEKHDFNNYPDNVVTAYHRDRGDDIDETKHNSFDTKEDALETCDNDYTYLFEDGKWFFRHRQKELVELLPKHIEED